MNTKTARIPPGTKLDLEARAEGYAPTVLKDVTATADMAPDALTFRMVPGVALRGQVLDQGTGRPLSALRVKLVHPNRRPWNPRSTSVDTVQTDGDGRFEFANVAAGTVHLKIARQKGPPCLHGPIKVPASGIMEVFVSVGQAGSIEGVLRNKEGVPLPKVKVTLRPGEMGRQLRLGSKSCVTDPTGRFFFEGIANTEYVLSASGEDTDGVTSVYRTTVVVRDDGPTRVELETIGKCSLRGRLRIAGHDGSEVFVRIYRQTGLAGGARYGQPFRAEVRAGSFTIRGLPKGAYDVYVYYEVMGTRRGQAGPKNVKVRPGAENKVEIDITPK